MNLPRWSRCWWGLFVLAGAVTVVADLTEAETVRAVALVTLMPFLGAFLLSVGRSRSLGCSRLLTLVMIALVFSWLGDAAGRYFLPKLGLFLVAQACYAAAFWPFRSHSVWRRPLLGVLYVAVVAALALLVAAQVTALAIPVLCYGATLALMATLSTGVNRTAALGGALFVVSDVILALDWFAPWFDLTYASSANLASYAAAQGLLVWGALRLAGSATRTGETATAAADR